VGPPSYPLWEQAGTVSQTKVVLDCGVANTSSANVGVDVDRTGDKIVAVLLVSNQGYGGDTKWKDVRVGDGLPATSGSILGLAVKALPRVTV
jgi:hypothetical protein